MADARQAACAFAMPQAMLVRPHKPGSYGGPGSSALEGLRGGDTDARVGLLPGLRFNLMDKYTQAAEARPRRAQRQNLDCLTAEQRVQRRKDRARFYSTKARLRHEQLHRDLENDVAAMRIFRTIIEEAPQMVMVLSMDIHCLVLYVNSAVTRHLLQLPAQVLGRSFMTMVHPNDRGVVLRTLTPVILTTTSPSSVIRCRLGHGALSTYRAFDMSVRYGSQGLVCTMWNVLEG